MKLPSRQSLMLGAAWALSSVTIVTISLAVYELVDDKRMALLYAGAFAIADLVKYMLWPTAREYFDGGRRVGAAALAVAATVLAVFSGLASAERFTSDLKKRGALYQAHQQHLAAAQLSLSLAQKDLARLDAEAAKASSAVDALRDRGMATPALSLATTSDARIDKQRDEARARMESAANQLAELQAQPLLVAPPAELAPGLGLGLALMLEILPALLLTTVRSAPQTQLAAQANPAASTSETAEQTDEPHPLPFAESCRRMANSVRNWRTQKPPYRNPPPSGPPNQGDAALLPRRKPNPRHPQLTPTIAT